MKKLEEYMSVLEYRTPGSKNKVKNSDGKEIGKPGEISGKSGDVIAELDPKVDDSVMKETDMEEEDMGENEAAIQERFDFEKPFFILGHAGWAKSSIVKRLAKKNGYRVLVVYLDKAVKEDLGGMPIVIDDPKYKGEKTVKMVPPEWAKEIIYNPNDKFLLFFDEMNQADPEVMNALMPIVQDNYIPGANRNANEKDDLKRNRCDNFLVGAAGNYHSENKATHELSGPLLSRFKPLIIWEDNNDAAWEDTFKFWRKDYEPILGKKFMDAFWPYHSLFDNPRELNEKLWDPFIRIKKKGLQNSKRYTADRIARYIYGGKGSDAEDRLIKKDIDSADALKYSKEMAEIIYDWLHEGEQKSAGGAGENGNEGEEENGLRRRGSSSISLDETVRAMIDSAVTKGYIDGQTWDMPGKLYAIGPDNIYKIFDPAEVNAESIKAYLKHLESKGITWKYKSVEEAVKNIKAGSAKVLDPLKDPDIKWD